MPAPLLDGEIHVVPVDFSSQDDLAAVIGLLEAYASTEAGGGAAVADDVQKRLADDLANRPGVVALLAKVEDQAVGMAISFEGYSTFAARPLLNLHDLVVMPGWRGKGIGGCLLEAVERAARDRGCVSITLEVIGSNQQAQRLYRRHGFDGATSISPPETPMFYKKRLE